MVIGISDPQLSGKLLPCHLWAVYLYTYFFKRTLAYLGHLGQSSGEVLGGTESESGQPVTS